MLLVSKFNGSMPEWLMGADCKSASIAYVGSNPTRPKLRVYIRIFVYNLLVSRKWMTIKWMDFCTIKI